MTQTRVAQPLGIFPRAPIPATITLPVWSLIVLVVLGASMMGVYTIGMVIIGEQFKGADLAAAGALYGLMFGAGSMIGPLVGGVVVKTLPAHSMPLSIAVMYALFLPFLLIALGVLGYSLAMPATTVLGATLDAHTLLFATLAILVGGDAIVFAVFTKVFAID